MGQQRAAGPRGRSSRPWASPAGSRPGRPRARPARPRESGASGVSARPRARRCSAMPGASRSRTSSVASGVTSRAARPVPPVVTTSVADGRRGADRRGDRGAIVGHDERPADLEARLAEQPAGLGARDVLALAARAGVADRDHRGARHRASFLPYGRLTLARSGTYSDPRIEGKPVGSPRNPCRRRRCRRWQLRFCSRSRLPPRRRDGARHGDPRPDRDARSTTRAWR